MKNSNIRFILTPLLLALFLLEGCEEQPVNLMVPYDLPPLVITVPPIAAPAEVVYGVEQAINMDSVLVASNLTWEQLTYIHASSLVLEAINPAQTISVPLDSIRIYLETDDTERLLIGHRYQLSLDSSATIPLSPDRNDIRTQLQNEVPRFIFAATIRNNFADTLTMHLNIQLQIRAEKKAEE